MNRHDFIVNESRCGQPPADFFRWTPEIRARIAATIHNPNVRRMLHDKLDVTNGLLVHFLTATIKDTQVRLHMWHGLLSDGLTVNWRRQPERPLQARDLPSIRAAIVIVDQIVDALNGVDQEQRNAA